RLKSNGFSEATNYFFCAAYICLDLRPLHSDLLAKSGGRTSFDLFKEFQELAPREKKLTRFPQIDHRIFRLLPPHSQRILVPIPGERRQYFDTCIITLNIRRNFQNSTATNHPRLQVQHHKL